MSREVKVIFLWMALGVLLITGRLARLQLQDNEYKHQAEINSLIKEYVTPVRGKIFDRNGKLLVSNQPVYSVYVIPSRLKAFDTLEIMRLLRLTRDELEGQLEKAKRYSPYKPSPVGKAYNIEEIAPFREVLYRFPGFIIKKRYIRKYHTSHAANILGYLREVSPALLQKDTFYERGDLVGAAGIEKYYENVLRGKKGIRYYNRDKFNRKTGPYMDGKLDVPPVPGKDIRLSIDIDLQAFIDTLMEGKHGAVVVMNPRNGEVLSLVSAPSYDPSVFNYPNRNLILRALLRDKLHKPLYDRSILGTYPPGSPFKLINALIDLQEGVVDNHTRYVCKGGFRYGNRFMHCHCGKYGPVDIHYAIPYSCNTFFSKSYVKLLASAPNPREGVEKWARYVKSFGLGDYLGIDLPTGRKGNVPDSTYYNRYFGHNRWKPTYIISNGIGQGQILVTPLQMANMTAAIANKGYFYTPHLIKTIDRDSIPPRFTVKRKTLIDSRYFDEVIEGMHLVYEKGTARYSKIPGIASCGKTGTAENYIKRDGQKIPLPDHSIFVAFAPKEDPQIVVSIFIENGGFGSTLAAPIASLIIEKYLKGHITRTDLYRHVRQTDLEDIYRFKTYGIKPKDTP